MRSVSIIGAGYSVLGSVLSTPEIQGYSERELFAEACMEAMENGNIRATDIDAFYLGCSGPNNSSRMKSATTHFSEWIGMKCKPTLFHDEGCGTSAFGLEAAVNAVASGRYDCVLSAAVNISSSVPAYSKPPFARAPLTFDELWETMHTGIDAAYEKPGTGGAGSFEAGLVLYCKKYGVSFEEATDAMVNYLITNRRVALLNPKAVWAYETYEEEAAKYGFSDVKSYLMSDKHNPCMGSLIRRKFVALSADGASAVIVCATDKARSYVSKPIEIAGISTAVLPHKYYTDYPSISVQKVFDNAYAQAGITDPYNEIDYLGAHDCPIPTVLEAGEASGYFKPGTAWKYMFDGETGFDGKKPVNTTGGRTQSGHPLSPAFGIEVKEAVDQMRGENGPRQIAVPPKTSVVFDIGSGWHCGAAVLKSL